MTYSFQSRKKQLQQSFYNKKYQDNPTMGLITTRKKKTPFIANPFGDLLTRIRNGCNAKKKYVKIIYSKKNLEFLNVLLRENLIQNISLHPIETENPANRINSNTYYISVELKYSLTGESRIKKIVQISTFSRRVSCRLNSIKNEFNKETKLLRPKHIRFIPHNEYTLWILNTSQGILSEREAIKQNVAGEILCWIL